MNGNFTKINTNFYLATSIQTNIFLLCVIKVNKMFSTKSNECVGFDSNWKVKRVYTEGDSQTTEFSIAEASTNTSTNVSIEIQTCDKNENSTTNSKEVDMQKLADWLNKIYPNVHKELNESITSKAFYGSYLFDKADTDPEEKLVQSINISSNSAYGDNVLRINALSWNLTGNTLAVASNYPHQQWCHHSGEVCFFTFDRNDRLPTIPNKKLSTSSCVTVLRFHPSLKSVIACGTYAGEIHIWNIQQDEGDNIVAKINGHEEIVTELLWIQDIDVAKSTLLGTSSLDGSLNLWNFSLRDSSLSMKQKYKIKSPVLLKAENNPINDNQENTKVERGIISFDFSLYVPDMFVVGIEGSLVVQCSMLGSNPLKGSTKEVPISDPVYKYYEPHKGEINKVCFSPNRHDIFLSNDTNRELRVYVIGQDSPARIIFLDKILNHITWVPYQEKLVVGCGSKGCLEIFNLIDGKAVPNLTSEKLVHTTFLQMDVNKQRCSTVAVGTDRGEVQLWNVPWNLFSKQK